MRRYEADDSVVAEQTRVYESLDIPHRPFFLTDEQVFNLGKKYLNCLSTQDYETRLHDYPIDSENNKPWKYLKNFQKDSKVLFLGAGVGRELLCGTEMGFDSYGITMSSQNINFGRHVLGLDEAHFVEACAELLPFPSQFFDIVAGFQIFEHSMCPLLFLLEQSRVLKDGGTIVLEWPAASSHGTHGGDPQHQVCFTPGQAQGLLLKSGFGNVSLFYVDMTKIPEENYWTGEQSKGYVVAFANKIPMDVPYINNARE